ncbi:MAG: DUF4011 domain-containing protein, partial [Planctomycetota bacterium]
MAGTAPRRPELLVRAGVGSGGGSGLLAEGAGPTGPIEAERLFARLRSALEEALASGIPAVARAARDRARAVHADLRGLDLPAEVRAGLRAHMVELEERFPTAWRVHAAVAAVERASGAPDATAQITQLEEAASVLHGGLEDGACDRDELEALLEQVAEVRARVESSGAPVEASLVPAPEPDAPELAAPPPPEPARLEVTLDALRRVHATSFARSTSPLVEVRVHCAEGEAEDGLRLVLRSTPPLMVPATMDLPPLAAGDHVELSGARLAALVRYDRTELDRVDEPTTGEITAEVVGADGRALATASTPWLLLPNGAWPGLGAAPEALAAFVLGADEAASSMAREAAPSSEGGARDAYRSGDPRRPLAVLAGVFGALTRLEPAVESPPASFERAGQRVRTPSEVAAHRLGTPLDLALASAAALEAAGLHPLVFVVEGHAFAGAWLVERTLPVPATDDPRQVVARAALTELVAFDPTLAARGGSFEDARAAAHARLEAPGELFACVDVRRARLGGVAPLGGSGASGGATASEPGASRARDLDADLETYLAAERRRALEEETPKGRLDRWLRQLLDLTMRNRLLNAGRATKRVLPLLPADGAVVEDHLAAGGVLTVAPRPAELAGLARPRPEDIAALGALLADGATRGELFAPLGHEELGARLLHLFREARTAREEGGASGLYLTIGTLVYYETPASDTPRSAPLLLLPLELTRESARAGFSFKAGQGEPRVNVTLLEALRSLHDIDVPGLDPLPEDESGVDVPLVLRLVREAVKGEARWRVTDTLGIGLFSFAKYLLWRDLKERRDDLRRSPLAAHLLDRPGEPFEESRAFPEPSALDDAFGAAEVLAPLSYDSTQLSAILAAAGGATFVLEGPPGTGKSQTITNLVAHAIANERTVLFVSEKTAALEVVHDRLVGLGLGPACLELHSAKASKKAVLGQFAEALSAGRQRGARRRPWEELAAELDGARARLEAHVGALHDERSSGDSLHGLIGALAGAPADLEPLAFDLGDPLALDAERIHAWRSALDALDVHGTEQDAGPHHPLLLVGQTDTSPLLEATSRRALLDFDAPCAAFIAAADALVHAAPDEGGQRALGDPDRWGAGGPATMQSWGAAAAFGRELAGLEASFGDGAAAWLEDPSLLAACAEDFERASEAAALVASHADRFRVSPKTLDLAALELVRRDWAGGGWFARWRSARALRASLRGIAVDPGAKPTVEDAARVLDEAQRLLELEAALARSAAPTANVLGPAWSRIEDVASLDLEAARARLDQARTAASAVGRCAGATGVPRGSLAASASAVLSGQRSREGLGGAAARLADALPAYSESVRGAVEAVAPLPEAPDPWADAAAWRDLTRLWADAWRGHRPWTRWASARRDAVDVGLGDVVRSVESGDAAPGMLRARFDRLLAGELVLHGLSADEHLRAFDGIEHERAVSLFRALDDERLSSAREEVIQRVARRRPSKPESEAQVGRAKPTTGLGLLQRELAKKARHVATRRLLAELGEDAQRLKPCFLMSPMSVAQFLEPDHPPFDLVVFDEASQIPVWDAVGAIARGRQAVVVGDPKQLPPTNFFARQTGDEDLPEDAVEDLESILDECIAAGVPVRRLAWHYRSKHESLIAFSNARYYGGDLVTFPSSGVERGGVSVRFVEDGCYEKGTTRTNPREAEAVVAEIVRRIEDPAESNSIGVVTFNQAQQTRILDALEDAQRERPELESALALDAPDSVFVKN